MGLLVLGVVVIAVGLMIWSTQRVENYWSQRSKPKPIPRRSVEPPPFIWSEDQCRGCGRDDELLNLDKQCIFCFHRAWVDG